MSKFVQQYHRLYESQVPETVRLLSVRQGTKGGKGGGHVRFGKRREPVKKCVWFPSVLRGVPRTRENLRAEAWVELLGMQNAQTDLAEDGNFAPFSVPSPTKLREMEF